MIQLSDDDLLLRLTDTEDGFVERKTQDDLGDCLKTVVAFANSTPVGYPAIMFVGVRDNGEIEGLSNPDNIQKSVSKKIAPAYPPIYTVTRVLTKDGKQFLAVVIPGSENRPHFAGPSFIRDGSQSVIASEDQFRTLMAQRNDKARVILEWKGKEVTFEAERIASSGGRWGSSQFRQATRYKATVLDCNQFYATLQLAENPGIFERTVSASIASIELGFDHSNGRLILREKF